MYTSSVPPRPQLILIGNSPVAVMLAKLGKTMGWQVDVRDPQATREQFPEADSVSVELNPESLLLGPIAFAVVATQGHDDEAALAFAVRIRVPFIAFVATKKKFAGRAEYLRAQGLSDEQIARIKAPAGLDIGAVTPDEIAASILAELIQVRRLHLAPQAVEAAQVVAAAESIVSAEVIDPICGMTVETATAHYVSEFRGERFYFCSAMCKEQFEKQSSVASSQ